MSAIVIVRRLVSSVRVIVNLVASFPEYALQLGDVKSVTHTHTHTHTFHVKVLMIVGVCKNLVQNKL